MRSSLKRLWKHESGQDAAEYALLIVGIVIVVVGAIYAFGNSQSHTFSGAAQTVIGGSSSGAGGGSGSGGSGGAGGGAGGTGSNPQNPPKPPGSN
jgi:Flp pilus assembly pilin Flp